MTIPHYLISGKQANQRVSILRNVGFQNSGIKVSGDENIQIIVIDDFWSSDNKSIQKAKAANNTGADFVSLSLIKGKPEYQCGIGTTVYDPEGREHIVKHDGVAAHPGDKGMKYIADAVISVIMGKTEQ